MKTITAAALALGLALTSFASAQTQTQPMATPNAPENSALKDRHEMKPELAKGHNSFTKGQARKRIQKAGYNHVMGLMKDHDGLWQAKAMKDGAEVQVAMDFQGNVHSN